MLACDERDLTWRWIYTAQHRETMEQTLEVFALPPPSHVVVNWQSEAKTMARMSQWMARMLFALPKSRTALGGHTGERHILLTHGDTFTTWLGALMGKVTRTPVMHVEAGLRSFHLLHPFPEEINRLIAFRLANYFACPGESAVRNVARYRGEPLDTGCNTQVDTLRFGLARCNDAEIDLPDEPYVVVSLHRYENIFKPSRFETIVEELERLAEQFRILFIQHPATRLQIDKLGFRPRIEHNPRISMLPRLEYLPFLKAVLHSKFVITDGGGNQEELSYLGKPTLIFRDETERFEGVGANATLAKLDRATIDDFVGNYQSFEREQRLPAHSPSQVIVSFLEQHGFGS